jgi:hypothetical protein
VSVSSTAVSVFESPTLARRLLTCRPSRIAIGFASSSGLSLPRALARSSASSASAVAASSPGSLAGERGSRYAVKRTPGRLAPSRWGASHRDTLWFALAAVSRNDLTESGVAWNGLYFCAARP